MTTTHTKACIKLRLRAKYNSPKAVMGTGLYILLLWFHLKKTELPVFLPTYLLQLLGQMFIAFSKDLPMSLQRDNP